MQEIKRTPTDVLWAVVYIVALLGLIGVTAFCIINGNPNSLLMPSNSAGHLCGEGDLVNQSFLYYFDITKCVHFTSLVQSAFSQRPACITPQVCISKCPTTSGLATLDNYICMQGHHPSTTEDLDRDVKSGYCASYILASTSVFNRCVPDLDQLVLEKVSFNVTGGAVLGPSDFKEHFDDFSFVIRAAKTKGEVMRDLGRIKNFGVIYLVMPWVIALALVILLGFGSYPLIVGFYLAGLMICLACTVVFSLLYYSPNLLQLQEGVAREFLTKLNSTLSFSDRKIHLGLSIVFGVVTVLVLLAGCLLSGGLRQVCACSSEASKAIFYFLLNFFMPFLSWCLQVAYIMWFATVCIYLYTSSNKEYRFFTFQNGSLKIGQPCQFSTTAVTIAGLTLSAPANPSTNLPVTAHLIVTISPDCLFSGYNTTTISWIMVAYAAFVAIWSIMIVKGIETFQVAYTFAHYYWNRKEVGLLTVFSVTLRSLLVCFMFHIGSIALGTLVITLIFALQVLIELLIRLSGLRENQRLRSLARWVQVALSVIQSLVERLTTSAFIHIAVSGHAFCKSTFKVIAAFAKFPAASILIQMFVKVVLGLGLVIVPTLTGFGVYVHLTRMVVDIENPIILAVLFSSLGLFISASVFSVYCTGILTIHHCACHDLSINDGTTEKPYQMSSRLRNAYGASNTKEPDESKN